MAAVYLLEEEESTLLRMGPLTQVHLHFQVQCKAIAVVVVMQEAINKLSLVRQYSSSGTSRLHMAIISKAAINSNITTMAMMGIQLERKRLRQ